MDNDPELEKKRNVEKHKEGLRAVGLFSGESWIEEELSSVLSGASVLH